MQHRKQKKFSKKQWAFVMVFSVVMHLLGEGFGSWFVPLVPVAAAYHPDESEDVNVNPQEATIPEENGKTSKAQVKARTTQERESLRKQQRT